MTGKKNTLRCIKIPGFGCYRHLLARRESATTSSSKTVYKGISSSNFVCYIETSRHPCVSVNLIQSGDLVGEQSASDKHENFQVFIEETGEGG